MRPAFIAACLVAGAAVAGAGLAVSSTAIAAAGLALTVAGGAAAAAACARTRSRAASDLAAEESFLERLTQSFDAIATPSDPRAVLEQARLAAERLFGGTATLEPEGERPPDGAVVPIRGRSSGLGSLRIERRPPLDGHELVQALVLADFAGRTSENARLVAQTHGREAERGRLSDQLITAEQEERRRLALFLHDGPVQNLAGIALMLDAVSHSVETGKLDEASRVLASALERHRGTIRALRDLSFNLEPVVLRDQGFSPAVRELAEQLGISNEIQIDLDVAFADGLAEKAQVVLYQIVREAFNQAIRRGPPTRISLSIKERSDGSVETTIADDGGSERRRATFDAIAERARTLNGQVSVERGERGTTVRVTLPAYTARG